jgi:hypothetical protein
MSYDNTQKQENILETASTLLPQPFVENPQLLGKPFAFVPDGQKGRWRIEPLESYEKPKRKAFENMIDVDSFLAYVNRFKTPELQLFSNKKEMEVRAVFDYIKPDSDEPAEGKHVCRLFLERSAPFLFWTVVSKNIIHQFDFAEILDARYEDVVDGLTLKEISLTIEAQTSSKFSSARRFKDGKSSYTWNVDVQTKAGEHLDLEVPEKITFNIPIFDGGAPVLLPARLRIACEDGNARFKILPNRWEEIAETKFLEAVDLISEKTGLPVYKVQ